MDALELKRFVWAYLLEQGIETTGEWDYYSGHWYPTGKDGYAAYPGTAENKAHKAQTLATIKECGGVDWDKTQMPKAQQERAFTDTFHPSSRHEVLLGTLVLKDGNEMIIGVGDSELRFMHYIETFNHLIEDKQRVAVLFGE